jgi:tRNA-specific 2-thiouridylase
VAARWVTSTAVELVTLGQRKGLGLAGGGAPRYVVDVDRTGPEPTVTVGSAADLLVDHQSVHHWSVTGYAAADGSADAPPPSRPVGLLPGAVLVQTSAHGTAHEGEVVPDAHHPGDPTRVVVRWQAPQRRVAPGQSVVVYEGDEVVAAGRA